MTGGPYEPAAAEIWGEAVSIGPVSDEEPRPRKRRRTGLLLTLAGGLLAVVLMVVGGIVVIGLTGDDPKTATGRAAHEAGRNLRKVAGLWAGSTSAARPT